MPSRKRRNGTKEQKRTAISAELPPDLIEELDAYARQHMTNRSTVVRLAVRRMMDSGDVAIG